MLSRNGDKINTKLEEIKKECPNIETMPLVADLGTLFKIEDYQEQIADKLKDLDVSVLAINAGYNENKAWLSLDNKGIQQSVMLNAVHPAYLAKVMAAQLNARFEKKGEKAAMVFVSSAASMMASPGNLIYSAAKIFTSYIGEGLYFEFEGKVDVINYMPASVTTNMNNAEKAGSEAGFITAEVAVETSLRDLGIEPNTYGDSSHENIVSFMSMFPKPMM